MDALTKVLVSLYEEADKPENALEYPFLKTFKITIIMLIITPEICQIDTFSNHTYYITPTL